MYLQRIFEDQHRATDHILYTYCSDLNEYTTYSRLLPNIEHHKHNDVDGCDMYV